MVYEPFLGSGTTLIAAETTGRICHAIELNPAYVDVAIQRWEAFTGQAAKLADSDTTFAQVSRNRATEGASNSVTASGIDGRCLS